MMKHLFIFSTLLLFSLKILAQASDSIIDFNSMASMFSVAAIGEKPLWSGTSFFIQVKKQIYLITNNHVVGGKYRTDEFKRNNKNPSIKDTLPNMLFIRLYTEKVGGYKFQPVKLIDNAGNLLYQRIYENPKDTNTILDVVAIPIRGVNNFNTDIVHGYDSTSLYPLELLPSQDLFVVGFPAGIATTYPIWKKGTIASEPNLQSLNDSRLIPIPRNLFDIIESSDKYTTDE